MLSRVPHKRNQRGAKPASENQNGACINPWKLFRLTRGGGELCRKRLKKIDSKLILDEGSGFFEPVVGPAKHRAGPHLPPRHEVFGERLQVDGVRRHAPGPAFQL